MHDLAAHGNRESDAPPRPRGSRAFASRDDPGDGRAAARGPLRMLAALPIACGGFLLAVLWFDLMFDVQVLRHRTGDLPDDVLGSIAAYYRRVTVDARPMGHAVGLVMVVGLAAVLVQLGSGRVPRWAALASLALAVPPIAVAAGRVLPNAIRLGRRTDPIAVQSALARRICRDHLLCLAAIAGFLAVQLAVASRHVGTGRSGPFPSSAARRRA